MIQLVKKILGIRPATDYKTLMKEGATVIDVRSKAEYQQGHIRGSVNIPLNNLANHISKLNKEKPVITCCASGMRSATAKSLLKSNGFRQVYNAGGWMSLQNKIS
jgi:rhodanese-related sulfurtransferase